MTEWQLVWLVPLRLLIVTLFALCYVIGGRQWKWIRRFVGGIFLPAAVIGLSFITGSFSWVFIGALALYPVALSMGYGGNTLLEKLIKRAIYGLILGAACLFFAIPTGLWALGVFQVALAILTSTILGVWNLPQKAVNEEALIAALSVLTVPFMV